MNKNLKKVISAVAALALASSTFTAFAATSYPDIPEAATYSHAVDELSALNVIAGYEDGTFQPDKTVTRAEFAKMVVAALGEGKVSIAEAAENQNTKFEDVNNANGSGTKHWAAGWITACVGEGIIDGMTDTEFAPDAEVTYVQAMKMLACAAGYAQWSVDAGGWPNGYLSFANQIGIGNGVTGITSNDVALTRAQVAQMIDNTIKAPVCVRTGSNDFYGKPVLKQKNGKGIGFQSILTLNHNAYVTYGRVTANSKSSDSSLKADEVTYQVEKATNFEDTEYTKNDTPESFTANIGTTNAGDYLNVYVESIVKVDDNGDYTLICINPVGDNTEVSFKTEDFNETNKAYTTAGGYEAAGKIYAYVNGKNTATSYKLDTENGVKFYVNGVAIDGDLDTLIDNYIVNNAIGEVTLVAETAQASTTTNGTYSSIMVTYYQDAVVEDVDVEDEDMPEIIFKEYEAEVDSSITLDYTDDDKSYKITKDGSEIAVADIKEDDVLSIKYDVTASSIDDSKFVEIVVSDKKIEGKYSRYNSKDEKYTIDGTAYDIVTDIVSGLDATTSYTFSIDAFGRIAYAQAISADKKIAILENVYLSTDKESVMVKVVLKDGSSETYTLKDEAKKSALEKVLYGDSTDETKVPYQNRVIEYNVSSTTGEFTYKQTLSPRVADGAEYRESTSRIGSYAFSDATSMLSASTDVDGKTDFAKLNSSALIDGEDYTAYFYDSSNSVYNFVIVDDNSTDFSKNTRMALYISTNTTDNDDYSRSIEVLVAGSDEVVDVYVDDSINPGDYELEQGDPIVYTTDASGAITDIKKAFTYKAGSSAEGISSLPTFADLREAVLANNDFSAVIDTAYGNLGDSNVSSKDQYGFKFGIISSKNGSTVDLITSQEADGTVDTTEAEILTLAEDVAVYIYNYNGSDKAGNLTTKGGTGDVRATSFSGAWNNTDKTIATISDVSRPQFALVRVLDEDIKEIVVFQPEK